MAVTARRRLEPADTRRFGSGRTPYSIPDLTEIQTKSYARFLQYDTPQDKRKAEGLEGVLKEIFPIESYDKTIKLEYLRYELGKPRYSTDECRQLRLTYGRPFRIWLYPLPNLVALAGREMQKIFVEQRAQLLLFVAARDRGRRQRKTVRGRRHRLVWLPQVIHAGLEGGRHCAVAHRAQQ